MTQKRFSGRLSRNTAVLLISNTGSAFLSFVLSVLIGRVLGETGLGIYAASLAWIYPISLISEFGIGTLITRDVAQNPENSHAYLRSSLIARFALGSALLVATWLVAPILGSSSQVVTGIRLSAPLILILPIVSSFTAIFRARQTMQPIAILNLGMLTLQVSLTAWVFYAGYGVQIALIVNVLTSAVQLLAAWWIYHSYFYQATKFSIRISELFKQAYPFAIAAILAAIQSRLNILVLERSSNAAEVGYYAAAFRFIEAGRLIPHAFFDALFPHLAVLATMPNLLQQRFRQISLGLLSFGIFFALGVTILGSWVIIATYGEAFRESTPILKLAAFGLIFMLLKGGQTLYWYAQGREAFVNRITVIVIVLQTILASWIIPIYGAIGAASIFIVSEALAFGLLLIGANDKLR